MSNLVQFNNQNIELISHKGQPYMTLPQIEGALEFTKKGKAVSNLYNQHKSEFDEEMSCLIRKGNTRVRIFNREGAWLIGMFARTPKAAEFRRWVLKVLGTTVDRAYPCGRAAVCGEVNVREHTRSLPSGKKEIVLSEKAKTEIGGIVKACLGGFQARVDKKELANRVVALMTSYNLMTQYDILNREARELRYQAEQREEQARSFMEAANKIEKAVAAAR
ncbi:MAG: Bro-N domain-containing protein [Alphaproteobacteria bacterium]